MAGKVRVHPRAYELLAHNVHARVDNTMRDVIGIKPTNEMVAEVLADALGYALAMCALDCIDQASLDQISARTPEYYRKTLAPFFERMRG